MLGGWGIGIYTAMKVLQCRSDASNAPLHDSMFAAMAAAPIAVCSHSRQRQRSNASGLSDVGHQCFVLCLLQVFGGKEKEAQKEAIQEAKA